MLDLTVLIALVTGYGERDARGTTMGYTSASMLILLFLYFGVIALGNAITNRQRGQNCAVLAIVGVVNIRW
jgi:ABC-type transport system involved in cytochrome c biogenesis permease subunit